MIQLYEHQKSIIAEDPKKTGLFLSTGSGKTATALMLAKGKILIICPKTQKEDMNWEREFHTLCETFPSMKEKMIFVISKEKFKKDWQVLPGFDTIIVDEAHTMLGVTPTIKYVKKVPLPRASQLFESLQAYIDRVQPDRIYLVTATIIRSPMTVWAAATILGKKFDFYAWREAFYTRIPIPKREIWVPKRDSATKDRLAKVVRGLGYIGRLEDFFDVPNQTFQEITVSLTGEQKKKINELRTEYPDPIVLIGKKHQVEQGILSGDEFNEKEIFACNKYDVLFDLIYQFPRIVIFAKYTAQIEQMKKVFISDGYKVLTLEGGTKDRGALLKEANESPECIFIAQIQISSGWELPDYPVMVFASLSYSVVDRIQAEGRILRANKLKKNLYIDIVTEGGIDEAVYDSIKNKKDFNERIYLGI